MHTALINNTDTRLNTHTTSIILLVFKSQKHDNEPFSNLSCLSKITKNLQLIILSTKYQCKIKFPENVIFRYHPECDRSFHLTDKPTNDKSTDEQRPFKSIRGQCCHSILFAQSWSFNTPRKLTKCTLVQP